MEEKEQEKRDKEFQKEMTNTRRIAMGLPPMDAPSARPPTTQFPVSRPPTTQIPASRPPTTSIKATQRMETPTNPNKTTSLWPGIPYSPGATRRIVAALEQQAPAKPPSTFAKPWVWLLILLVTPTVIAFGIYIASPSDSVVVDRSTTDFEKHVNPANPGTSSEPFTVHPGGVPNPKAPNGFVQRKYNTGNIEMKIYRKPGDAVREKGPKKTDALGSVMPGGGSGFGDEAVGGEGKQSSSKGGPD